MSDLKGEEAQVADSEIKKAETQSDADLASIPEQTEQTESEPKEGDKQRGYEKRIAKLTREKKEREEALIRESQRSQYLESQLRNVRPPESASQTRQTDPNEPVEPNEADYSENVMGYAKAMANFATKKVKYEHEKFAQQQQQGQRAVHAQSVQREHDERVIQASVKYEDFEEVVKSLGNLPIDSGSVTVQHLVPSIMAMPDSAEISYWLGKNPIKATEIANLSPEKALIELGKVSAKLEIPEQTVASEAPEPASRVDGKAASAKTNEDFESFRKRLSRRI